MGSLNFQDDQNPKPPQRQPDPGHHRDLDDAKVDDIFVDGPGVGPKLLLIAVVVIVIAGIGGGLYLLNQRGILKFGKKTPVVVVQPPVTAPPVSAAPAPKPNVVQPTPTGKFAIQVSAFKNQDQANRAVQNLKKKGVDAYVFAGEVPNEGKWFKVCVGSYDTKLRALAETEMMKQKVGTDVWVISAQ
ncbi:MAG TPA: SPOR domain-containing protein [Candidatus Kryptonia bacterium]